MFVVVSAESTKNASMTNDPRQISRIDRHPLEELQANGRLSNAELAARINTSESSCLRHRQRLEKAGIIKGYAAVLDRDALGYSESAFVKITCVRSERRIWTLSRRRSSKWRK